MVALSSHASVVRLTSASFEEQAYRYACLAQIFFDDNVGHTAAHIVDARDVRNGEPLAFKVSFCARRAPSH